MRIERCRSVTLFLLVSLALAGCGSDEPLGEDWADGGVDGGDGAIDVGPDLSDEMYLADHVLDIEIDMLGADWDQLRKQARSAFDVLGANCLKEAPVSPFTYFPATVHVDGVEVREVGVRKKGFFGSLSESKPSLKLKFSEYLPEQRFSGLKRMTLNNNKSDVSHVKQCIGYDLFTKAGIASPRCSFAKVTLNGEYLGVFTHVESIKKPFIGRHFADDSGNLYEGALSDFRPGWVKTFQRKTNRSDPALDVVADLSDVRELVDALVVPDDVLLETLEPLFDLKSFLDFWVMETIIMHADGYARNANNFYLYGDPVSKRFHFIPWGIDSIFFQNTALPWEDVKTPESIFAEGVLARRLYQHPEMRDRYLERMEALLDTVWDEGAILGEVNRMETLLKEHVKSGVATAFASELTKLRSFVASRRSQLRAELDAEMSTPWNKELREPWCLQNLGNVSASFSGQWADDITTTDAFADGSLTLTSTLAGLSVTSSDGGTTLGVDPEQQHNVLRLVTYVDQASDPSTQPSTVLIVAIVLDDADLAPQSMRIEFGINEATAIRMVLPPAGAPPEFALYGVVGEGVLELDAIGGNVGDALQGSLDFDIYSLPF